MLARIFFFPWTLLSLVLERLLPDPYANVPAHVLDPLLALEMDTDRA